MKAPIIPPDLAKLCANALAEAEKLRPQMDALRAKADEHVRIAQAAWADAEEQYRKNAQFLAMCAERREETEKLLALICAAQRPR